MKTRTKRIIYLVVTFAVLGVLLSAGTVSAETLFYGPYELQNWSKSGPGETSITPSSGPAIHVDFSYNLTNSGYTWKTWTFSTTATETETFTFDWHYTGNHSWHQSFAKAFVFAEGPSGTTTITLYEGHAGPYMDKSGNSSIQVNEGYTFGFITMGKHFDSANILRGKLTIFPDLPPGWDEGNKSGWDSPIPPGLDKNGKAPPGFDQGKKAGWSE